MTSHEKVVAALERHGSHGGRGKYQCPAHDDRTPSLSVTERDGRVLLKCWAGCDTLDVLESIDLGWSDLFDEPARGKDWTTSTMRSVGATVDGDGRAQLGAVRYLPGGTPKTLAVKDMSRDLWPDPATVAGDVLYVVEGEPDAVSAAEIGLPTVAVPGSGKWSAEWGKRLAAGRRRVVVLPDADAVGRRAAAKWAEAIAEHGVDVRIVDLHSTRDDGADLSDYVASSCTDEHYADDRRVIAAMAEAAVPVTPSRTRPADVVSDPDPTDSTTNYVEVEARYSGRVYSPAVITEMVQRPEEPVPYRVDGVVADGTATLLSAGAGMGKSVFAQALCDGVTDGRSVAGFACAKGTALYIDGEMGSVMFANRLRKMGVKSCRYWYVDALGLDISIDKPDDLGWIRQHIERVGANLVVIDSLRRLMPSKSENDSDDMAPAVGAVAKLARDTNAAIILVHHKGDGEKFYRGSTAIKDQADALFGLLPVDPEDDDDMRRRLTCRGVRGKAPRYDDAPPDRYVLVDFSAGGVVAVDAPQAEGTVIPLRQAVATAIKAAMPVRHKKDAAEKIGRHSNDTMFRGAWEDLERAGEITQTGGGWVATDTSPRFESGSGVSAPGIA